MYATHKYRWKITNQQSIANSFNNYFLTAADKITSNIKNDKTSLNCNNPYIVFIKTLSSPVQI